MSMPVFVRNIGAFGIEYAEGADEFPEGKTDLMLMQNVQHIAKPGEKYSVRSFVPAAAFAAMNTYDTLLGQFDPGLVIIFQQ